MSKDCLLKCLELQGTQRTRIVIVLFYLNETLVICLRENKCLELSHNFISTRLGAWPAGPSWNRNCP